MISGAGARSRRERRVVTGKTVLVTGGSSGIGRATAEHLADRGATLLLVARSKARLAEVADGIRCRGGCVQAFPADLSSEKEVAAVQQEILAAVGAPDIIVHSAGAGRWLPLVETPLDEARRIIEVPALASIFVTRAFLPAMIEQGSGQIVIVTSPASHIVWRNACCYIAARHALKGFADALRVELRGTGVALHLVTLGTVESPYWQHNPGSRAHVPAPIPWLMPELSTDEAAETIISAIEHRRRHIVRPWFFRVLFLLKLGDFPQ